MFIKSGKHRESGVSISHKLTRSNLECIIFCAQNNNCILAARESNLNEKYNKYECSGYQISNLINSNIDISETIMYKRKTYPRAINDNFLTTLQTTTKSLCETPFVQFAFGCYYMGMNNVVFEEAEKQCTDLNISSLADFADVGVSTNHFLELIMDCYNSP